MVAPKIAHLAARRETCTSWARLSEGMYVEVTFTTPTRVTSAANVSERLSDSYGLGWKNYTVHIGDVELSYSRYQSEDRFQLDEVYAYTNPKHWTREALTAPPTDAPDNSLTFAIPYDDEEVAYTMGNQSFFVSDQDAARLQIRFTDSPVSGDWVRLSNKAYGIVNDGGLLALQFESFLIEKE